MVNRCGSSPGGAQVHRALLYSGDSRGLRPRLQMTSKLSLKDHVQISQAREGGSIQASM